ncbi:helix-turn-helix domain-containing protein [Gloeocapsa sp. PCC 73106]|uniref:helix-turn-helix domain-containing protein n=1 Tax=Gloeocapsa sp. PCC 73106 TaxID=102232 RepID=UPI0002AC23EE|nr:helix-turn-helix transcriptional regulator [Gloeocapsa sp. PCC 73106]ELR97816.1 Helix-turn-helix protein [Gloeocapsa sp. PCC 73106]
MTYESFSSLIRRARKSKGYSQRELAGLLGLDFTYLSKLENDRAEYAPKEEVIRNLARHLALDEEELIFLAGRIPQGEEEFLKQHYQDMPILFRRMRENPEFAKRVFQQASKIE